MVNLLIVTHGEFGAYLVEAAEGIVGRQAHGVRVVGVSPRLGLDEVRRGVVRAMEELHGADGLVIVTDMPGGSPANLVLPLAKDMPNVRVLSGLNLYMLVSAFNRRRQVSLEELSSRMIEDGRRSIRDVKAALLERC